jgi:hypothetical protein
MDAKLAKNMQEELHIVKAEIEFPEDRSRR